MCGGAESPQTMADAEVNGVYADIQNSVVIRSIFGEMKKTSKKLGENKKQSRLTRLMWKEGERMEN